MGATATNLSPAVDGLDIAQTGTANADVIATNTGTPNGTVYATGYLGSVNPTAMTDFTGPTGIHTDGANYLAADGHVKWLRGAAISPGTTAALATDAQAASNSSRSAAGTGNLGNFALTFSPT